ncbi:HRDC domain-containing protein [candidate division FCPU426 bacterium]|nr:HRDC domain-containing protein [candidate division FCPU426 bacterium]
MSSAPKTDTEPQSTAAAAMAAAGQAFVRPFCLITRQEEWEEFLPRLLQEPALALDVESNGYFRYPDRICLIQIGLPDRVLLLDPLSLSNLKGLGKILASIDICKVFHSCENDLRALNRDYGFSVRNIFDTALAAHFLGSERLGLANVLQAYLHIDLPKSKVLQRQDWTARPLDQKSLAYASGDVSYLLPLQEELTKRLQAAGRYSWVQEENSWLERIKADAPVLPEEIFWFVKGSRKLNDRERAVLQQLAVFRENLCRELDRPPFRVLSDDVLIAMAQMQDSDLKHIKGLTVVFQHRRQSALRQALRAGRKNALIPVQKRTNKKSGLKIPESAKPLLARLKKWREVKGKALSLDPAVLWPMSSLERLAIYRSMQKGGTEVREWQKQAFAGDVEGLLERFKKQRSMVHKKQE